MKNPTYESDPRLGDLVDKFLDTHDGDLSNALNDACLWLLEYAEQANRADYCISAGYIRKDTGPLYAIRKRPKAPPLEDDCTDDSWIKTGVEYE